MQLQNQAIQNSFASVFMEKPPFEDDRMMRLIPALLMAASVAGVADAARAAAPEPVQPVDADRFMGRWYEILRTPNDQQKNCYAAYQDWTRKGDRFAIKQVCHRDSPDGRESTFGVSAKPLNPEHTKWEASFFGGLIRGRYWVSDHDPAYNWMIATTEDGRFPKLMARRPGIPEAEQAALKARMAKLGFRTEGLQAVGK